MTIENLFLKPASLPVIPNVVHQLIESFQQEDVSTDAISTLLAADPVLAAKTLRLANSAYFHVSRKIETLDDALRMLGFVMVRNLVISVGIVQAFRHIQGLDLPLFWRHTACVASGARFLASLTDDNADLASMIGLTQGLGQLVMRATDLEGLPSLDRQYHPLSQPRAEAELQTLGYHHGQVAAELARRWKFPEVLSDALAVLPDPSSGNDTPLVRTLRMSLWNARRECLTKEMARETRETPESTGILALCWQGEPPILMVIAATHAPQPMPSANELSGAMAGLFTAD